MRLSTFCAHLQIMGVKAHAMATWGLYVMRCVKLCSVVSNCGKMIKWQKLIISYH